MMVLRQMFLQNEEKNMRECLASTLGIRLELSFRRCFFFPRNSKKNSFVTTVEKVHVVKRMEV